ncbi:MAG TPA: vitamin K epoxide reductase family protein [Gemmatimonadaceae bacterium]|nr:vitamin K epoxide reductase family protein [Gemmatimonadaceae bacterium]
MRARQAIALLALAGAFVALYLTLYKIGVLGTLSCSVGECETVNTSRYATFLRLPVAAWGLGAYVVLFALAIAGLSERLLDSRGISRALAAISGSGVLFSLWLTYLELFVIHAICIWCVTSACIITALFATALIDLRRTTAAPNAHD